MAAFAIFAALMIGHALADCPLQTPSMSKAKRRSEGGMWVWTLSGHASIHAGAVWLITGSAWLAGAEYITHAAIDFAKCEGRISARTDQIAHVACKIVWAWAAWRMSQA